jgi:1,2-diacylglycerol-3-alpha-glucose alpha-1,2-galactosyltransferase
MPSKILTVNMISETEFGRQSTGVHTAYLNISKMLRSKGVEVLVNSKVKADITHLQTAGRYSVYKLLTNKPTVASAHVVPQSFLGSLVGVVGAKYWYWEAKSYLSFFYNRANLVLAVAPKVATQLAEIGVKTRVEVFPNPVDRKVFYSSEKLRIEARKKFGISAEKTVVLAVGQQQPRKGIEDFWNVAQELPELEFVWVGGRPFGKLGADNQKIDFLLSHQPKNVKVITEVNYQQMNLIYNLADTFFLPSYQENAPMAVIEAASCGLPLILRDIPEYELLYKEGYLKGKNETFTKIVERISSDRDYYKKAREDALKLADKFSFGVLGDKLLTLYREVLEANG